MRRYGQRRYAGLRFLDEHEVDVVLVHFGAGTGSIQFPAPLTLTLFVLENPPVCSATPSCDPSSRPSLGPCPAETPAPDFSYVCNTGTPILRKDRHNTLIFARCVQYGQ